MNKERIIKLLESTCLEDIILGVQFSYELSFEEFKGLYKNRDVNLPHHPNLYYRFWREGIKFGFGSACFIIVNWDEYYNNDKIIDITPKIEEL